MKPRDLVGAAPGTGFSRRPTGRPPGDGEPVGANGVLASNYWRRLAQEANRVMTADRLERRIGGEPLCLERQGEARTYGRCQPRNTELVQQRGDLAPTLSLSRLRRRTD